MIRRALWIPALLVLLAGSAAAQQSRPLRQIIDEEIRAGWQRQKITPSAKADDSAFVRRIYLDLLGVVPSLEEARSFLDDKDAKKREKLIDRLLGDPRHAAHQAEVWDLLFFGRNPSGYDATRI